MLAITAHCQPAPHVRLLRPQALLRRLRPFSLRLVCNSLAHWELLHKVWALYHTLIPDSAFLANHKSLNREWSWDAIFSQMLYEIERLDWFPIDLATDNNDLYYGTLDWLWDAWQQVGDDEEMSAMWELAEYLIGIPVRLFGFNELDCENFGVLVLMGLLTDHYNLGPSTLVKLGLWDNLDEVFKSELLHRCLTTDFSHLPEPLCWVDDMARIAASCTGNPLFDHKSEMAMDWYPNLFTWENDVDAVKAAWQAGKHLAERRSKFVQWLDESEENVRQMVAVILGEENVENDDEY